MSWLTWKRTDGALNIYSEFEGKEKRKYWIQDLTEEYFEEVMHLYRTQFAFEEPIMKSMKLASDRESSEAFNKDIKEHLLTQNASLLCLTKGEDDKPIICGFFIVYIDTTEKLELEGEVPPLLLKFFSVVMYTHGDIKVLEKFNTNCCAAEAGLFVTKEHRGQSIGEKLLIARGDFCKKYGIKVSIGTFTSIPSQKQAEKVGYKELKTTVYDDLPEELKLGLMDSKVCKYMYHLRE